MRFTADNKCYQITYKACILCNVLTSTSLNEYDEKLNSLLFGFMQEDLLVPQKVLIVLPPMDDFVPNCQCKACLKTQDVVFE